MTTTIVKRLEIDAGHRLMKHEGKCAHVHGHRYAFEVEVAAARGLDDVGRVVDFGVIKATLGAWLDDHWDHACIVQVGDPLLQWLQEHSQRHFVVAVPPTAENLAQLVFYQARALLPTTIEVVSVACHETPTSVARFRGGPLSCLGGER